ncbi:MAG: HNH endonuclease [Micropepsaceae bacterium]
MAYGVFIFRSDSIYDDDPAVQYQFPAQYLSRAEALVGDWILYLEPTKVAQTRGYFATARVQQIIADPKASGMHVAIIEPGSYLDFPVPVSFSDNGMLAERGLLNDQGKISGRAQAAVRPITAEDFNRILNLGLDEESSLLPRTDERPEAPELNDEGEIYDAESPRERVQRLSSRIARDRAFRISVLSAYDETCAITGLKLINGGGRAEVAAAHIRPVAANGPDSINNGIALSGTAHWMFDRGLISLSDDMEILVSRHVNDVDSIRGFLIKSLRARTPARSSAKPHPRYLQWHRANCFKL